MWFQSALIFMLFHYIQQLEGQNQTTDRGLSFFIGYTMKKWKILTFRRFWNSVENLKMHDFQYCSASHKKFLILGLWKNQWFSKTSSQFFKPSRQKVAGNHTLNSKKISLQFVKNQKSYNKKGGTWFWS